MAGRVARRRQDCHAAVAEYIVVTFEFAHRMFRLKAPRDRDRIYGTIVTRRLHAMGIRDNPLHQRRLQDQNTPVIA
jgi:hypothetical protein